MGSLRGLVIRDGVAADIPTCLKLDHSYETEYVWQINIHGDNQQRNITLRRERLPRNMAAAHPITAHRLEHGLTADHAFLVAAGPTETGNTPYAYLVMTHDPLDHTAHIRDLVVDQPYRRAGIGTRLVKVAARWARERGVKRIFAETQTKNYPAIQLYLRAGYGFCGFNDQYFDNQDIAIFFCQALN
jgi:GNAT superfamily N-acetyltransferase